MTILMQVLHTEKYKINYSENRGQKGGSGFCKGWHSNSSQGHGHGHGRVTREMLKDVVCEEFKTKGKCHYGTRCWKSTKKEVALLGMGKTMTQHGYEQSTLC